MIEVRFPDGRTKLLAGERVFLNVGTRAAIPDVPGLSEAKPLTHVEALELGRLPDHLIVLGGGYVGLELAQPMRRFGSRVTVVEQASQLVAREDGDVAQALRKLFKDEDIDVVLSAQALEVEGRSGEKIRLRLRTPAGTRIIEGSDILVAAGRAPNTQGIGLETAGVELDARGYVKVNERLETTAPDVWAMGDCAGSPQFTHAAFDDFRIVRDNLNGGTRTTQRPPGAVLHVHRPRTGASWSERIRSPARRHCLSRRRDPMTAVLRTRTLSETRGFLKALIATDSDRILGFTALGAQAGELIAVVQTAMLAGAPYTALRDAILTHPTIAEGLTVLFASEPGPSTQEH